LPEKYAGIPARNCPGPRRPGARAAGSVKSYPIITYVSGSGAFPPGPMRSNAGRGSADGGCGARSGYARGPIAAGERAGFLPRAVSGDLALWVPLNGTIGLETGQNRAPIGARIAPSTRLTHLGIPRKNAEKAAIFDENDPIL